MTEYKLFRSMYLLQCIRVIRNFHSFYPPAFYAGTTCRHCMEKSLSAPDDLSELVLDESQYTEDNKLGQGMFAEVYRIYSPTNPRKVRAVKAARENGHNLLQKEWRILSGLEHPNIVKVNSNIFTSPTRTFMVMEYVKGRDLFDLCAKRIGSPPVVVYISSCILKALAYIHPLGVFHRDLKLENVLIGAQDLQEVTTATTVKVCDFGLSSKRGSLDIVWRPGSNAYAAPEIYTEDFISRSRADIYSFSIVFYAMCRKHLPLGEAATEDRPSKATPKQIQKWMENKLALMEVGLRRARHCRKNLLAVRRFRQVFRHSGHFDALLRRTAASLLKFKLYSEAYMIELMAAENTDNNSKTADTTAVVEDSLDAPVVASLSEKSV